MQHLFWNLHLVVTAVLCLPLMTTSTVILFIKICLKSKQMKRGRLLVMILITLLCFLILNLPLYIYVFITHFLKKENFFDVFELSFYLFPSASLNSSVNPVIYFLVGRKKRAQSRESIKIKRNPFTVLILNLAIADFGHLIFMTIYCINIFIDFIQPGIPQQIFISLFNVTYINGLFLLTAISIDRCVSVLFPIWHRCSRPKYLSPALCAILWIFSFLLAGISSNLNILILSYSTNDLHMIVTAVICLLLITTSTVILFIKICFKSKQLKHGRILVMILITLLCFLILTLPLYIYVFIFHFIQKWDLIDIIKLLFYFNLCAPLNCSVNPVIYFLVGRKKRARFRESIKVIFQRVFREDEAPDKGL
ncbi:Mrgprh: Mas-related G-protein coupled receptor member H [Crotalus adamanteus]|uniref:Mrgprh: Mas-related G-protein coupled receptor member H n=1 Tax=Crotalus adamanteus TaxID=8729 RepID=A0AAW1BLT7_CROAD